MPDTTIPDAIFITRRLALADALDTVQWWNNQAATGCVLASAEKLWPELKPLTRADLRDHLGLTDTQCVLVMPGSGGPNGVAVALRSMANLP